MIEAEIVARIGRDLPQGASEMRIIDSIESLVPGIETADVISHGKTSPGQQISGIWLCTFRTMTLSVKRLKIHRR